MGKNLPTPSARCCLAGLLLAALAAGCGGNRIDRVSVRGNVTYAGQPVEEGFIKFRPLEGTIGPISYAVVKKGRYELDHGGGVPVGRHQVVIQAYNPDEPFSAGPGGKPRTPLLPARFNTATELEVTLEPSWNWVERDFALDGPPIPGLAGN